MKRGFADVGARIDGTLYHVVSTHLESDLAGMNLTGLRAAQASELAAALNASNPAIVMGDLNDPPGSLMYQVLQLAGFQDVWAELRPAVDGFTNAAVHPADLSNTMADFTQRIDYVWARDIGHPKVGLLGQVSLFGNLPDDRVDGPYFKIWPSDHAAVEAELLVPPAVGLTP